MWAKRELPHFSEWHARYVQATESPEETRRLKAGLPNKITDLQMELESGLLLQGATAIEDKLQVRAAASGDPIPLNIPPRITFLLPPTSTPATSTALAQHLA